MNELITHALTVFMGFFAIMNPLANTAVFVGLTGNYSRQDCIRTARKSLMITFVIITAFALLGHLIFHFFGITIEALRITGGILVFLIGYHMLQGSPSKMHTRKSAVPSNKKQDNDEEPEPSDISVSPLAMPILAGPGTIATAMNYSSTGGITHGLVTVGVFAILCIITFICFVFGNTILSKLGTSGVSILTRLMGLLLAIIGTQMLIDGIHGAIKAF